MNGAARPAPALRVIVGPTAAGKTALAMSIAAHRDVAIVSADSRQVYTGFDIGTAKPDASMREAVPHYGIDVCEPTERYSAHRWTTDATGWIDGAVGEGRTPLVVGGTGFYVHAMLNGLVQLPVLDPTRRDRLAMFLDTLDRSSIATWCSALDPARATLGNAQHRRAIEIALLTGRRLSDWIAEGEPPQRRDARVLVIDPAARLHAHIERRVAAMFSSGWAEETERLMRTIPDDAPAWKATGYGTMRRYITGEMSRQRAAELVVIETRQYAKRQRTWFRHQLDERFVTHIDPDAPDAAGATLAWWDASGERSP